MSSATIAVEVAGAVAKISLDDASTLNALSLPMLELFIEVLDEVPRNARAMILTGKGRAFCAGANLATNMNGEAEDGIDAGAVLETHFNPLMTKLRDLPIPWISAVRGPAAGLGSSIALAADMIVASETAYFLQAFSHVGLVPDGGASFLLARTVGRPRAMEMMLLGERVPARTALDWGLVNRIVPDDELDATALSLATRLADGPTQALGLIRRLAWQALDVPWHEVLAAERKGQKVAGRTLDYREGVSAFLEKRLPQFVGK